MTFGERLKALRLEKNMRQEDLAKVISVHRATIGKYETNERFPSREILIKLAEYFHITVDYLIGYSNIRNPYLNMNNNKKLQTGNILEKEVISIDQLEQFINTNKKHIKYFVTV